MGAFAVSAFAAVEATFVELSTIMLVLAEAVVELATGFALVCAETAEIRSEIIPTIRNEQTRNERKN